MYLNLSLNVTHIQCHLSAEQKFHEEVIPSLTQAVKHLTLWSNLPPFMLQSVNTNCTSDTFIMESVCNNILEQAQQLNPQLIVVAVAIQLSSDKMVKAIQFRTEDCIQCESFPGYSSDSEES